MRRGGWSVTLSRRPYPTKALTYSSHLYRAAARTLAATVFNLPNVESVCVRRSVAAGEAVFPFSDLDLDITVYSNTGRDVERLRRRYALAKALFPRTGHCFVMSNDEIDEVAEVEPYRGSINERCCYAVRGAAPYWPSRPIPRWEAARRVVFWLERFFPTAVRNGHVRHQRKFYWEIRNALGLLEGRWEEPFIAQRSVQAACPPPTESYFGAALGLGAQAHRLLGRTAPAISMVFEAPGLTILPTPTSEWPRQAMSKHGIVATPECLDLLLEAQCPTLWLDHGPALSALGFAAPSQSAWMRSARRLASPVWLRGPGFFESRDGSAERRVAIAGRIVEALEQGTSPAPGRLPPLPGPTADERAYYLGVYDQLSVEASSLRSRARALEAAWSGRELPVAREPVPRLANIAKHQVSPGNLSSESAPFPCQPDPRGRDLRPKR